MRRFWDGYWSGVAVGIIGLVLLTFVFAKGIDFGRDLDRADIERAGGGRWIEITIDSRQYKGWVR